MGAGGVGGAGGGASSPTVATEGSAKASGRSRGAYSGPSSHVAMTAILGAGCGRRPILPTG